MDQLEVLEKEAFEEVWSIMEESFPLDERRNRSGQKCVLGEESYQLYGSRREGKVAAFFAVWHFPEFAFIEHFAVEKNSRNGGIGAELLQQLLARIQMPVILEVEPPEAEISQRRIAFYERNGFTLNGYDYIQPAMSEQGREIPLMLMSSCGKLSENEFYSMKNQLYRVVYKQKLG